MPSAVGVEDYLPLSGRFYYQRRYAEAIKAAKSALKVRPDYAETTRALIIAMRRHFWKERSRIHVVPTSQSVQTLNTTKADDQGTPVCEQALRYKSDFELVRNNLAWAQDEKKK